MSAVEQNDVAAATVLAERTVWLSANGSANGVKNYATTLSNGSPSSSPSSRSLPADDMVRAATFGTIAENRLVSAIGNITATPPPVFDLATLLHLTTQQATSYLVYEHQCYWFAHTVIEALDKLFPTERTTTKRERENGTCPGLQISKADSVDAVVAEYQQHQAE
ncbi:hypothetical protein HYDPIDRAFT_30681 [Hydnomerulius pinastri MD-312]|uniref:Uncharacterized protein n=1 Tax=Hydnomerulius pinastri MD-312 TaxID=994086 RepID=A0A0C9V8V9_9AGAM|nr:hypothetical protein HYDPIDRAFT_30681 [Hydnomerulius pinastri MD-312]